MIGVVITTINVPELLYGCAEKIKAWGRSDEVVIYIIGDLKTPAEAERLTEEIASQGIKARFIDVPTQQQWLRRFPVLGDYIPYNSDNRRNIGYLMAAEDGAEIILIMDDDNFVTEGDFFGEHSVVGTRQRLHVVNASTGWFNVCEMMATEPHRTIYPRGFPYSRRWVTGDVEREPRDVDVVVNAGLWLGEPDVDSITRLNEPVRTVKLVEQRLALGPGTWSPINSQNTAVHRRTLPCFYYFVMGVRLEGLVLDRFGDIFSGFFAKKVIDSQGDSVAFGPPLTDHRRNSHDLLRDLRQELEGIRLTEDVIATLDSIKLSSGSYAEAYLELSERFVDGMGARSHVSREALDYFRHVSAVQHAWVDACRAIGV